MGSVGLDELKRPSRDKAAMRGLLARAVGNLQDAVLITDGEAAADGQRHIVFVNEALPPVRCEPKRLSQVLLNVVVNALDAIPLDTRRDRGVTIHARRRGNDAVVVTITDQGTGIPAAILPRVFDPFFTTKPTGKGTGLGLSIAQAIVRAAGGTLTLDSAVGTGTTVTIELPTARPSAATPLVPGPGPTGRTRDRPA